MRTSREIITLLNSEFAKAAFAPDVKQRLQELGAIPVAPKPEEVGALIKKESEQWSRIIKRVGTKLN